jgi:hypothetical protein
MSDWLAGIGIFVISTLATIGSIWLIQQYYARRADSKPDPSNYMVSPQEYLTEVLYKLPALLSVSQIDQMLIEVQNRYQLSEIEAEELLTAVIRSNSFERVTGARCTCFAESKTYGKFFHASDCEYRRFLNNR